MHCVYVCIYMYCINVYVFMYVHMEARGRHCISTPVVLNLFIYYLFCGVCVQVCVSYSACVEVK